MTRQRYHHLNRHIMASTAARSPAKIGRAVQRFQPDDLPRMVLRASRASAMGHAAAALAFSMSRYRGAAEARPAWRASVGRDEKRAMPPIFGDLDCCQV